MSVHPAAKQVDAAENMRQACQDIRLMGLLEMGLLSERSCRGPQHHSFRRPITGKSKQPYVQTSMARLLWCIHLCWAVPLLRRGSGNCWPCLACDCAHHGLGSCRWACAEARSTTHSADPSQVGPSNLMSRQAWHDCSGASICAGGFPFCGVGQATAGPA